MDITEVRIKLTDDSDDRLQAFCSITFDDCFVVRDLKIIEGTNGPFVAMPSRKLTSHCPRCGCKNHLRGIYCNQCGNKLHSDRASRDQEGRAKLYADIAHPINSECREMIQQRVISEYQDEIELAKKPGYVSRYEDEYQDELPAEEGSVEKTADPAAAANLKRPQFEPPSSEPRAPHQPRMDLESQKSVAEEDDADSQGHGFGAGIFED